MRVILGMLKEFWDWTNKVESRKFYRNCLIIGALSLLVIVIVFGLLTWLLGSPVG